VREDGRGQATTWGGPQGGVSSPLVAHLDVYVRARDWTARDRALGRLTRWADDGVLGCRTRAAAPRALEAVTRVVPQRTRTRPPTQTSLVEWPHEGFACLGCHVQTVKAPQSGRVVPLMGPSQHALTAVRWQRRGETRRRRLRGALAAMAATLNALLRGWRTACRVGTSPRKLPALDRAVRRRLRPWGRARLTRAGVREPNAWRRPRGIASCNLPGRGGGRP
jgi:hypothetical protein